MERRCAAPTTGKAARGNEKRLGGSGCDLSAQECQELTYPGRMSRPGWGRYEVPVNVGVIETGRGLDILTAGLLEFRLNGRIATAGPSGNDARCREDLNPVTDRSNRLCLFTELANQLQ